MISSLLQCKSPSVHSSSNPRTVLWKKLIECFDPEMDANGSMGMILYVPLRVFISMFLIPFWLLLGILSAGWLWPPQVREGLFVQKVSMPEDSGEAKEMEQRMEEVRTCGTTCCRRRRIWLATSWKIGRTLLH